MTAGGDPGPITVGIDIGTTSVKALAVTEDGLVLARARVPHRIIHTSAHTMEHDASAAWRRGPLSAYAAVADMVAGMAAGMAAGTGSGPAGASHPTRPRPAQPRPALPRPTYIAGICVAGMVPSLTAVDRRGMPRTPGLLYGDIRGWPPDEAVPEAGRHGPTPDAEGFLQWTSEQMPDALGYWPAQAVATHALTGHATIDTAVTSTLGGLYRSGGWNEAMLSRFGVVAAQLPEVVPTGSPAATLRVRKGHRSRGDDSGTGHPETVVAGGSIDAFCDQIVAGADETGDVLVIFGATLVVWVVTDTWVEIPGLWTVPHTSAGRVLVGGPSNAGALFVDWARSLLRLGRDGGPADDGRRGDPLRVPVWLPYLRGERVPYHDASLRACLSDLDITDGPSGVLRAAYESSGFVIRDILERTGTKGRRIVASGGGTHVRSWMAGVADATGLPVETVAVPEGAALGAAYLARMAVGLERSLDGSARWSRRGSRIEPDPAWQRAAERRFQTFTTRS